MLSFHGKKSLKTEKVKHLQRHRELEHLKQGVGFESNGRRGGPGTGRGTVLDRGPHSSRKECGMKPILLTLRLCAALLSVAGILCLLDLLYQFWILWFIPAFAEHPAGLSLACAAVLLLIVIILWGGGEEF